MSVVRMSVFTALGNVVTPFVIWSVAATGRAFGPRVVTFSSALGRTITIAEVVGHIKAKASKRRREHIPVAVRLRCVLSQSLELRRRRQVHPRPVGTSSDDDVSGGVRLLCKKHSVEVDERYVWD